ncbi:caspase-8 isoform X2 [Falco biarmicus]|uniref:caspase-8 isoform X2 n=2 Tax=Falco peregrinus TaxID=8954 RepID=UPI000386FA4E|nr:caspase-8 isoform X2 [Falco peregrinus]XP_027657273.1 caspase-8 isoform X2 [Falco cherrug]XP_037254077.1 caspase-8-like isoform X1 [Falco rusticolus]XP_037254078.1 caspase-8-like isoform X1 [Falco rusticolus]XP_037254079.1 caspase-8-like isoform X1 [Falco rusticolus]XP_037254081.1 caspase-8-like isoform X1 [Falco rusticolus]XP_055574783.1 caspase-8 isoform X2 [Falco cherrug]XP_055574784.1 caspase-8 isoform X2 [Falco cherrug]XP_055574785.1 caspase-8 isoform X2 [Falco cherrug]XP_055667492
MSKDFHKLLFAISEALITDELEALKFLSLEHIPMRKLEAIREPKAFFEVLQEKDMMEAGNLSFLKELLYRINRIDLLGVHLDSSRAEMERELQIPGRARVSAYRQLLYEIAEDLTPEDVKSVKFLLQKQIPKNKLQDNASMLKVFLEMERNGIIKEDDLAVLKDTLKGFRADLKKKIDTYEEKRKENDSKEKFHHPVSASVHAAEQGAEGETPHLVVESYKMKNNPHGYCVILNNYIFKNPSEAREGTVKDGEAVKRVFKWLQFETVEHMDLEAKQMYAKVEEYSKKDHSNMDCFVCFIFSHGEKDKIKGVDHQFVNIRDLVSCFSGSNCPSLAGKPKLFFIQACQGSAGHPAVTVKEDFSSHLEVDATPMISIPDQADILIGMATVEDYECYRCTKTGSIYVQCLCDKMELLCPLRKDLITILTEVNKEVGGRVLNGWKQMPKITSTLRKQLIFQISQCQSTEK